MNSSERLHPFGIEKTFVSDVPKQDTKRVCERLRKQHKQIASEAESFAWARGGRTELFDKFKTDPGCVEITSEVFDSYKQAKEFFEAASVIPLRKGLVHRSDWVIGCGGHIHVDKNKHMTVDEQRAMIVWGDRNPWITGFAHPEDDMNVLTNAFKTRKDYGRFIRTNATKDLGFQPDLEFFGGMRHLDCYSLIAAADIITGMVHRSAVDSIFSPIYIDIQSEVLDLESRLDDDMSMALATRNYMGTFEFRCFDATSSWAEQKSHIDFAQAVVAYVKKNAKALVEAGIPCYSERIILAEMDPATLREKFTEMIEELGLSMRPYRKYLKNFEPRYDMDRKYLAKRDDEFKIGELQRIPTLKHNELVSRIYAAPVEKALQAAAAYGDPRTAETVRRSSNIILRTYNWNGDLVA